jgi:hypothetical protein
MQSFFLHYIVIEMYSTSQYNNRPVPYEASYQYYTAFLNGGNPNPQYPYDAMYDRKYQKVVLNPSYKYYGDATDGRQMNYPYYVQRHRAPSVYYNSKPYTTTAVSPDYRIPDAQPYMYWYPNPVECEDTCGKDVCNAYYKAMNDNRNCQRCQRKDPPQCWDSENETCIDCPRRVALASCNSRNTYGCANPRGFPNADSAPINPVYTGCQLCSRK